VVDLPELMKSKIVGNKTKDVSWKSTMKVKSRKRAQLLIVMPLLLLVSSCVEVKGDLGINSAARLSGELI